MTDHAFLKYFLKTSLVLLWKILLNLILNSQGFMLRVWNHGFMLANILFNSYLLSPLVFKYCDLDRTIMQKSNLSPEHYSEYKLSDIITESSLSSA